LRRAPGILVLFGRIVVETFDVRNRLVGLDFGLGDR